MVRVRVIKSRKRGGAYADCVGCLGTVVPGYEESTNMAVMLDDRINFAAKIGCFWFDQSELKFLEGMDEEMENNKNMEGFEMSDIKGVVCGQYLGGSTEHGFAVMQEPDVVMYNIDDIVVVPSHVKGYSLVRITRYPEIGEEVNPVAPIVSGVDVKWYEAKLAQKKRKAELQAEMKVRAAQLQNIQLYEQLAALDPNMAELVKEFKELG